jgi:hypothetical protein
MPAKMTTAYRQHDRGTRIVGESYRKGLREVAKTKRRNATIDMELSAWKETFGLGNPALLIRQGEMVIDAPRQFALSLIMHGIVRPVADFNAAPTITITEDELEQDGEPTQEPSVLTIELITDIEHMPTGTVLSVPASMARDLIKYGVAIESSDLATVVVTEGDLA